MLNATWYFFNLVAKTLTTKAQRLVATKHDL